MYEERFIAFIDILGFGALVEESSESTAIVESIADALLSMNPAHLQKSMYAGLNADKIPAEELETAEFVMGVFNEIAGSLNPVKISYFSDSLVVSAAKDDVVASQNILELLAKLSVKLWRDHSLLIRGGITLGKLHHVENGPLFGPSMNRAYHLESKQAVNPRVIFDADCLKQYRSISTFKLFDLLIDSDGEYSYFSLPTCFRYIAEASTVSFSDTKERRDIIQSSRECLGKVNEIISSDISDRVRSKYNWLASEIKKSPILSG